MFYYFFFFRKKVSLVKFKLIYIKILTFFTGLFICNKIEETKPIIYFYDILDNYKGLKIFTLQKVIEFICILMNRFFREFDIQILSIIYEKKLKNKIFTYLFIIVCLSINIISILSYIFCVNRILNDPKKSIYPLLFKINYIELKKCGKPIKKKNFMSQLNTDIFDRFFNFFVIFNILFIDYSNNKILDYKFYFSRISYLFFFEIFFDYIKNYVIYRISYFNSKILKYVSYEIAVYYFQLKENIFTKQNLTEKEQFLKNKKLYIIGKQYKYDKFSEILPSDDIICLTLQNGMLIYCIILINSIFKKANSNFYSFIIFLLTGGILRKLLNKSIYDFMINFEKNHRKKLEEESLKEELKLYVNDPKNNTTHLLKYLKSNQNYSVHDNLSNLKIKDYSK